MPRYTLPNGKSVFSETELPDDELESMFSELDTEPEPQDNRGGAKKALDWAVTPTNLPSRVMDPLANAADEPMAPTNYPRLDKAAAQMRGFEAGVMKSLGNYGDFLSSPADLATMAATGGGSLLGKLGLKSAGALSKVARGMSTVPVAHGVSEIADGNILGGGLEAGLGALGVRGFNPKVAQNLDEIIPSTRPRLSKPVMPDMPTAVEPTTILPEPRIPEKMPVLETTALDTVDNAIIPEAAALPETTVLPETVKPRPVLTLDYSPSSELRARQTLERAGVTDLDGLSNKQIIEMAEQSKPGHQKPKIKVRLDRETNTLVPDNDDPVTISVLKSAKTNKPVPQRERISPNTEVEMPDPDEMARAYQPELGLKTPDPLKPTAKAYSPEVMGMLRQDAIAGLKFPDAYKQMVPGGKPDEIPDVTKMQEYLSIPRAMQSMWDLSFPLRQGIGLIHTKGWWKAWPDMIRSAGDEGAYRAVMDSIAARPNFRGMKMPDGSIKKSFAQEAGLAVSDLGSLSTREENLGSKLAEKWVPGLRGSNRAYTAFANKLRADTFDSLIADAERAGRNPKGDMVLAKSIANYVNNASGRGDLGKLEGSATVLNNLFFSPRLMASRIQMLNPTNYLMADPFIKRQYWKSMAGMVGAYSTFTALNNVAGGKTGTDDPTSSDFGRTAIGNTRFDPSGGILPYLTLFARIGKGTVDMLQGNEDGRYTGKYGSKTGTQDVGDFFGNKAAPALSNAIKFYGADKNRPYEAGDQALRMFTPIMLQDLSELLKENPSMAPFGVAQSMFGIGTNTYEEGEPQERLLPGALDFEDFNVPRSFRR